MATQFHRKFMTYEEFATLPREGAYTMLLDGEYIVSPSGTPRHQTLNLRLAMAFGTYLAANPVGVVFVAPLDVVLSVSERRVVQPDVFFIAREHLSRVEDMRILGVPDLAIEVLSRDALRYDKGKKLAYYDRYGLPELWHLAQREPRVEVFRRDAAGRLCKVADIGPGGSLTTPLLPGFELSVDALYEGLP